MAERRMFTKKITDDDHFSALSSSAQALYLHLSMSADDDGFCNQVSIAMFKAHASTADLEQLLNNRYVYQFENGVIVIKHWRMANALRKDRYTPTVFQDELSKLGIKENGSYTLDKSQSVMVAARLPSGCQTVANGLSDGCQVVADCLPQDRLDKVNIEENNKDKINNSSSIDISKDRGAGEDTAPPEPLPETQPVNSVGMKKASDFYEDLIIKFLKTGNNDQANHFYKQAKELGYSIDITEVKRKAGTE